MENSSEPRFLFQIIARIVHRDVAFLPASLDRARGIATLRENYSRQTRFGKRKNKRGKRACNVICSENEAEPTRGFADISRERRATLLAPFQFDPVCELHRRMIANEIYIDAIRLVPLRRLLTLSQLARNIR